MNTRKWLFKNIHLIVSIIIVIPTGIIYGSPTILPQHLDIQVSSIDLANMLKAIMCLYIGISLIWTLGIWKSHYWKFATQLNVLFMLTLATGRIFSMLSDGIPTDGYLFGVIAEFLIGVYALYQLRKYNGIDSGNKK